MKTRDPYAWCEKEILLPYCFVLPWKRPLSARAIGAPRQAKSHARANMVDARLTRDELNDSLLKWRKGIIKGIGNISNEKLNESDMKIHYFPIISRIKRHLSK